jgi:hypothetical protein
MSSCDEGAIRSRGNGVWAIVQRTAWSGAIAVCVGIALAVVTVALAGEFSSEESNGPSAGMIAECSHQGGGAWETVWNFSSQWSPSYVWVPQSGVYWAIYNDTSLEVVSVGWGGFSSFPNVPLGETYVNLTSDNSTAQAMMQGVCESPGPTIGWHLDPTTQTFVRD